MSSSILPFDSQVANITHEQWLYSEAQKMLETKGLGAENLCTWQGSVYGAFDIESDDIHERTQQDWGLSQLGENGEEELPSLIIQSCWAHEYKHMFSEMQQWMKRGAGVVQMAILLKWTLVIPDPGAEPVLHSQIEVFEYAPKTEAQYRRILHEEVLSTEERELHSVKITARQLFGGKKPRGRGASYALNLTDLWYMALDIFDAEIEEWNTQGQPTPVEEFGQTTSERDSNEPEAEAEGADYGSHVEEEKDKDKEEGGEEEASKAGVVENGTDEAPRGDGLPSARVSVLPAQSHTVIGMGPESVQAVPEGEVEEEDGVATASAGEQTKREVNENRLGGTDAKIDVTGPKPASTSIQQAHTKTTVERVTAVETSVTDPSPPQAPNPLSPSENVIVASQFEKVVKVEIEESEEIEESSTAVSTQHSVPRVKISRVGRAGADVLPRKDYESTINEAVFESDTDEELENRSGLQTKAPRATTRSTTTERTTEDGTIVTEHTLNHSRGSHEQKQESIAQSSHRQQESVEEIRIPPKTSRFEVSITQDSGSAHAKTDTFEVSYDQTLTLQKGTGTSVDIQCSHCLSNQCCHGPQSPLRHLPRDFMSAGVLGPFSWCGFVVYLSLSTLQPIPEETLKKSRPTLIERVQDFTEETHKQFPPEDVGPLKLTTTVGQTIIAETAERLSNRKNRERTVTETSESESSFTRTTETGSTGDTVPTDIHRPLEPISPVEVGRGKFQSPEPKSILFGIPWVNNTTIGKLQRTAQEWIGNGEAFPAIIPGPEYPTEKSHTTKVYEQRVDTESIDRTKSVSEEPKDGKMTRKSEVTWEQKITTEAGNTRPVDEGPTGLGITIQPQQPATSEWSKKEHTESKTSEEVVTTETVVAQETTTMDKPAKSPRVEEGENLWQIVSGVPDGETGATIGQGGNVTGKTKEVTITSENQFTGVPTVTSEVTEATTTKTPQIATNTSTTERKDSTTVVTEEITQMVENRRVTPDTITKTKTVTVLTESTDDGHVLQPTTSTNVHGTTEIVDITKTKETETSKRPSTLFTPSNEPDNVATPGLTYHDSESESESEEEGNDRHTFAKRLPGDGTQVRPELDLSFANDSVNSFESIAVESIAGPDQNKTKKRSSKGRALEAVGKVFDAFNNLASKRRHRRQTSQSSNPNASKTTLVETETTTTTKDNEGCVENFSPTSPSGTPTHPDDDLAKIPPKIVSQMQQKLNLESSENTTTLPLRRSSNITRRKSGGGMFLERPNLLVRRTNSIDGTRRGPRGEEEGKTFGGDGFSGRKVSHSTIFTSETPERRSSDDSMFSHAKVSENESTETAPPSTPSLGGDNSVKVTRKTVRKMRRRMTGNSGTVGSMSDSEDEIAEMDEMDEMDGDDSKRTVKVETHVHNHVHHDTGAHDHGTSTNTSTEASAHEDLSKTTSTTVTHTSTCEYLHSTGSGLVQCECGGEELVKFGTPPSPESASTEDIMAQLKALLSQLQGRSGKKVIPRLGVNMTCEIVETEEEEVEVEVEVRVKYKSKKSMEHVGICERTRGLLGVGGMCPIVEELMGRA